MLGHLLFLKCLLLLLLLLLLINKSNYYYYYHEGASRQTYLLASSHGGRRKLSWERDVNSDVTETDQSRDLACASVRRCWWSTVASRLQHAERLRVRGRNAPRRLLRARLSQRHLPVLRRCRRYVILLIIIVIGPNACCSNTSHLSTFFPFYKVVQLLRASSVLVYTLSSTPLSVTGLLRSFHSLIPETTILSVNCHPFYTLTLCPNCCTFLDSLRHWCCFSHQIM